MKVPTLGLLSLVVGVASLQAQSTINATNKYAYAANLGWVNARGDTANGVVIGEYVCRGFAYAANVGWINFGSGTATNGVYYSNASAADFGINQDGTGRLRGYAYGANIGWINFEDTGNPTVDLLTGRLSGFVYSANCGWISLNGIDATLQPYFVATDIIRRGLSTAGDGIPDAWKILNFGTISNPLAAATADPDGDGKTNLQEYLDGTNPNNPNSALKITVFSQGATQVSLTWTSVPPSGGYRYTIETNPDLLPATLWADSGLGFITPSGGTTTSRNVSYAALQYFYRVRAFQTPLLQP
jgi:hypothetical protein